MTKLEIGSKYNWKGQPERLVYVCRVGVWYQFAKVDTPNIVWCEVLAQDLHKLEETE